MQFVAPGSSEAMTEVPAECIGGGKPAANPSHECPPSFRMALHCEAAREAQRFVLQRPAICIQTGPTRQPRLLLTKPTSGTWRSDSGFLLQSGRQFEPETCVHRRDIVESCSSMLLLSIHYLPAIRNT